MTEPEAGPPGPAHETPGPREPAHEPAGQPAQPVPEPPRPAAREHGHRSFLKELPFLLALALLLTVLLRMFVVQAFFIPSGSMEQTLKVNDRVVVNKVPYRFREPRRGEVVVFNGLDNFDEGVRLPEPSSPVARTLRKVSSFLGFGAPSEKDYIKRVIAVAGDRVMCCDQQGRVVITPKGRSPVALDEPYIYEPDTSNMRYFCEGVAQGRPAGPVTCPPGAPGILVPEGRLWVMGDHRSDSADSRYHIGDSRQGTVPVDKVVGRAVLIVTPLSRWGTLPVPDAFAAVALPGGSLAAGLLGALPVALVRGRLRRRGGLGGGRP